MHDALFPSILAAPDDDIARLVYADWLEEQGDSPRAEFIRLQIAGDLQADALLAIHRAEWIIPDLAAVQTFRRGFVDGLQIAAAEFVTHAERIGRLAPITDLRLPVALDHLAAIAAVPWLDRLTHLDLTGNVGLGSRLDYFFGLADLPRLRSLELRNCQLWAEHATALNRLAPRWSRLTRLNLSGNPLGDNGVEHLASSAVWSGLEELVIRCDEQQFIDAIHAIGAAAIANSPHFANLKTLDLNGHYIGDAGFTGIAESRTLRGLIHLDVGYNELGTINGDVYDILNESAILPKLKTLILDGNRISSRALETIVRLRRLSEMKMISIDDSDDHWSDESTILQSRYSERIRYDKAAFRRDLAIGDDIRLPGE